MKLDIHKEEVHVWYLFADNSIVSRPGDTNSTFLSNCERSEMARLLSPRHRRQYFQTRVFLRSILSAYEPSIAPDAWVIERTEHGRPFSSTKIDWSLDFNISHSNGLVVVAISKDKPVGIDVEFLRSRDSLLEKAHMFLSTEELDQLALLPADEKLCRVYQLWTLKEAFLKARGLASFKLAKNLTFDTSSIDGPVPIVSACNDELRNWYFRQLRFMDKYEIAMASNCSARQKELVELKMHNGNFWLYQQYGQRQKDHVERFPSSAIYHQPALKQKGTELYEFI